MIRLGIIGYGLRMDHLCEQYICLRRLNQAVEVTAVVDPSPSTSERVHARFPEARVFDSLEALIAARPVLDGLMIGTRCDLHASLAARAAELGKPLFLEKPVGINLDQLRHLRAALAKHPVPVVVSFPLRCTLVTQRIKEIIDSGIIGTVEHVQYLNNVPYGDIYFYDWYRDHRITGGLFLQKATHDFDLINHFLGEYPRQVCAMTAQRVYGGDKPNDLECKSCPEREECPESSLNLFQQRFDVSEIPDAPRHCLFSQGIGNEDCGSALLEYPSGRQAVYSQNFFVKKGAGRRGAMLMGARGTIDFDFYRNGSEIRILFHHTPREETISFTAVNLPHWGGDLYLLRNFLDVVQGRAESLCPLDAGLMSALTGMQASASARNRCFEPVNEALLEPDAVTTSTA